MTETRMPDGRVVVVGTPIGNLGDLSPRAVAALEGADVVACEDTRRSGRLLQHAGIPGKRLVRLDDHTEAAVTADLVARAAAGDRVALVSDAGTPGISDPGFLLVRAAVQAGIAVECLPGPTAFVPALVVSGLPCERFVFEGFLPQKKGRRTRVEALRDEPRTIVLYESPYRIVKLLGELSDVLGPDRPASVSRELSKLHEETVRGTLAELQAHFSQHEPRGEFVVCVGGRG